MKATTLIHDLEFNPKVRDKWLAGDVDVTSGAF